MDKALNHWLFFGFDLQITLTYLLYSQYLCLRYQSSIVFDIYFNMYMLHTHESIDLLKFTVCNTSTRMHIFFKFYHDDIQMSR